MKKSTRKEEITFKTNAGTVNSRYASEFMLKHILKDSFNDFLIPYFIIAICAGIESGINDAYIDFMHKKFGKKYKAYLRPYLFMNIRERFKQLIPLISNYKYLLNEELGDVKSMFKLFELRNQLIHIKHYWHNALETYVELEEGGISILAREYLPPIIEDPYKDDIKKTISKEDLKKYMKLYNKIIPFSHNLFHRISRKNFNPSDWFIENKKV